jgi:hypothetical protein
VGLVASGRLLTSGDGLDGLVPGKATQSHPQAKYKPGTCVVQATQKLQTS